MSKLGLEAGSGAGGQTRLGGPLQGRETGTRRTGEELRPGELRTAGNRRTRWRDINRDRGRCRGGDGVAGGWEARWRVKKWTKKFNPPVDNLTVAVPKPKLKGNEGVKVGRGDEHLGRARVDEEPVPFLHGHVEGLDVREFRWETTREAGE